MEIFIQTILYKAFYYANPFIQTRQIFYRHFTYKLFIQTFFINVLHKPCHTNLQTLFMNNFYEKTYYYTKFLYKPSMSFMEIFTQILYFYWHFYRHFIFLWTFIHTFYTNILSYITFLQTYQVYLCTFFIQTFLYKPIYHTNILYKPTKSFYGFFTQNLLYKIFIQIFSCKRF